MKPSNCRVSYLWRAPLVAVLALGWLNIPASAEQLPFRRAVALAVEHSSTMAFAEADQERAEHSYRAAKNLFLPQMVVGSGLAASFGFPLSIEGSAPSLVNVNSQQFLYNPSQKEFIRAAKTDWKAATTLKRDRRDQVILETALTYLELESQQATLSVLRRQEAAAMRVEQIVGERVAAGVDSEMERTRARLGTARVRMRLAEVEGSVDVLRTRLAQLTGLAPEAIETVGESVPELPEVRQDEDLAARARANSPLVSIADARAEAQQFRAAGEHKALYPALDLVAQYSVFSRHNNYDDFFQKFQRHNGTFGVAIRFPFLNFSQRARAEAADAEAVMARKQAEAVKQQVTSETLHLQRAVRQLHAAREVARLEYQLARGEVDAVQTRVEAGTASLREEQASRITENDRYNAFLESDFVLQKVQMQLLRATGELENWAMK